MSNSLHTYEPTPSFSFRERGGGLYLCKSDILQDLNYEWPNENDFANNIPCPNNASNAMQNYVHNYEYDLLGNMLSDAWKTYQYDPECNFLLGHNGINNQYQYDLHGNITLMSHLSLMSYDSEDRLFSAGNGTFTSYYNYDLQGNRTRKVVEKGNIREERYYIGGYEIYRKYVNDTLDFERTTVNISDDEKVFARIETETGETPIVRFQYDNHLGSACLELDENGDIISYEEYHPFGTTSYRAGRSETEVSLKRYKYNGKERDEETGLYAYGMRYYAAWLCRFISVDPLQFEYPELTPFQYASNNPVTMIDFDGLEGVKPAGDKELEMIKNTLTPEEAQSVQFDKNGFIDKELLNSYTGEAGENFQDLKNMVNSDGTIDVKLVEDGFRYGEGDGEYLNYAPPISFDYEKYGIPRPEPSLTTLSTGEGGNLGITLLPTKESNAQSPDNNIKIYITQELSPEGRAETFAHEAYGHANFFVKTGDSEKSTHNYSGTKDLNTPLIDRISRAMQETRINMKKR